MLGANREALGCNHFPALNLRFKGYTGIDILGSILIYDSHRLKQPNP